MLRIAESYPWGSQDTGQPRPNAEVTSLPTPPSFSPSRPQPRRLACVQHVNAHCLPVLVANRKDSGGGWGVEEAKDKIKGTRTPSY